MSRIECFLLHSFCCSFCCIELIVVHVLQNLELECLNGRVFPHRVHVDIFMWHLL